MSVNRFKGKPTLKDAQACVFELERLTGGTVAVALDLLPARMAVHVAVFVGENGPWSTKPSWHTRRTIPYSDPRPLQQIIFGAAFELMQIVDNELLLREARGQVHDDVEDLPF